MRTNIWVADMSHMYHLDTFVVAVKQLLIVWNGMCWTLEQETNYHYIHNCKYMLLRHGKFTSCIYFEGLPLLVILFHNFRRIFILALAKKTILLLLMFSVEIWFHLLINEPMSWVICLCKSFLLFFFCFFIMNSDINGAILTWNRMNVEFDFTWTVWSCFVNRTILPLFLKEKKGWTENFRSNFNRRSISIFGFPLFIYSWKSLHFSILHFTHLKKRTCVWYTHVINEVF